MIKEQIGTHRSSGYDDDGYRTGGTRQPSVAIVILNWNGKEFLSKFLPSVLASTYEGKRVIVADNGSTDGSVDFLKQHFPAVEIIINFSNEGFAKGYNTALQKVQSDYYVLLNSDVEVTPGWIEPVIALMESDPLIGACQPKLLQYGAKDSFEYAGACGGWIDAFGYPFARGRIFDVVEKDSGQYNQPQPCFWASGAAMFVKAAVYHGAGGFDEYFFAHQEEIDLCWRLQLAGYKVYVQPASVVYHVGGGTLPQGNHQKLFLNFRNNLVMLSKNLSAVNAFWKIPLRMGLDIIAAYKELFAGHGRSFIAIAKAHFYFIKWLATSKKKPSLQIAQKSNLNGWYNGSLAWQFFIKKKTLFSEIINIK